MHESEEVLLDVVVGKPVSAGGGRGKRASKARDCLCVVCNTECWRSRVPPTWLVLSAVMVIQVRQRKLS